MLKIPVRKTSRGRPNLADGLVVLGLDDIHLTTHIIFRLDTAAVAFIRMGVGAVSADPGIAGILMGVDLIPVAGILVVVFRFAAVTGVLMSGMLYQTAIPAACSVVGVIDHAAGNCFGRRCGSDTTVGSRIGHTVDKSTVCCAFAQIIPIGTIIEIVVICSRRSPPPIAGSMLIFIYISSLRVGDALYCVPRGAVSFGSGLIARCWRIAANAMSMLSQCTAIRILHMTCRLGAVYTAGGVVMR